MPKRDRRRPEIKMLCESPSNNCEHEIPASTWRRLEDWRTADGRDARRDLFIVRSECAVGYEVLQRYGNYCVIKDDGRLAH